MQADGLHREAALLSNTLHQYREDDVEGVKPVIDQILAKRAAWKKVQGTINYFKETGKLPAPATTAIPGGTGQPQGVAELKLELNLLSSKISKAKAKLAEKPDHKKAELWAVELDKMEAMKQELKQKIVELTYATT